MGTFLLKAPLKTLLPKPISYREALIGVQPNILLRFVQSYMLGFRKQKIVFKLTAVSLLIVFLLGYEPTLAFPPLKKAVARADEEQSQSVNAEAIPQFTPPFEGYISNRFSWYHPAIDIATGFGTPIHPIASGVVSEIDLGNVGYGNHVYITHEDGYRSLYAHMDKIYVQKDQTVSTGDIIGTVGLTGFTTGPHTHLEISKDGKNINPEDILPKIGDSPTAQYLTPYQDSQATQTISPEATPAPTTTPTPIVVTAPVIQVEAPAPTIAPVQEKLAKTLKLDL